MKPPLSLQTHLAWQASVKLDPVQLFSLKWRLYKTDALKHGVHDGLHCAN